jgi:hypothetical protein
MIRIFALPAEVTRRREVVARITEGNVLGAVKTDRSDTDDEGDGKDC